MTTQKEIAVKMREALAWFETNPNKLLQAGEYKDSVTGQFCIIGKTADLCKKHFDLNVSDIEANFDHRFLIHTNDHAKDVDELIEKVSEYLEMCGY